MFFFFFSFLLKISELTKHCYGYANCIDFFMLRILF